MPAITGSVPNLINGISQQAPSMRLPSQAEMSENFYPTLVDGNIKRPRTNHLAVLGSIPENAFTHFILRDKNEKYVVAILDDGTIRVWDFDGNEKTVNNNGAAYLAGVTNPREDIRALTVADHTFIVNKKKVVQAGNTFAPTRPHEALINVITGNYGKTYRVRINGVERAAYETPDGGDPSHSTYIDTVYIAGQLWSGLAANGYNNNPWAIGRYHSTIYIRNTQNDFSVSTEDGYGGRAMKDVKGTIQKFSDLPLHGPDGVVIKVAGDNTTSFDDYWVEFQKRTDNEGSGVWKECVAPGARLGLDASTMPHILVREADGTFTFKAATWDDRKCGDEEKNPDPSFVGQTIEEVFFHKDRLGFLTKENCVLSEFGKFYNFYRTTLTALLDTDPIDVGASHIKVSLLRHALPYQKELILFTDETQFVLTGKELLTPKTVSADPITELPTHTLIRPVAAGSNIYIIAESDEWATIFEYFLDKALETADYDIVTGHAPVYIPAGVRQLIASPDLDLLLVSTDGDPDALYVYKWYWNGEEKLQSAWCRWTFPNVESIINMVFDKGNVRLLVRRNGTVYLETLNAEQSVTDPGLPYRTYLDQHVLLSNGSYVPAVDTTTFVLPYSAPSGLKCVTGPGGPLPAGVELTPLSVAGNTVMFSGDLSTQPVRFGVPYESRYRFSPFFHRTQDGRIAIQDGRTQILWLSVIYARSAYFRVEVTCEGRPTRVFPFNGRIIGDPDNKTGELVLDNGRFSVPIFSRNDRVIIDLVNDTWLPCAFTSAEWRGTWNPSTRQQ